MKRKDLKDGTLFQYAEWKATSRIYYVSQRLHPLSAPSLWNTAIKSHATTNDLERDVIVLWQPSDKAMNPLGEVTNQDHYAGLKPEPVDVIESWGLGFNLASALAYISRHGRKHPVSDTQDLRKAISFLWREVNLISGRHSWNPDSGC